MAVAPCFFKIMTVPDHVTDYLLIPPDFNKHIPEDLSHGGFLKVPSGGIWPVRLRKIANEIFLEDGWAEFVRDNSLGNNEFLLFTYHGNLSFHVQIFDQSGLERVRMSDSRPNQRPVTPENNQARLDQHRRPRAFTKPAEGCSSKKILSDKSDRPSEEIMNDKGKQKAIAKKKGKATSSRN